MSEHWFAPGDCEGCGKPATTVDSEGVPLCGGCSRALLEEWMAKTPEEKAELSACCGLHRAEGCCDPADCGPCCEQCPTCPTLAVREIRARNDVLRLALTGPGPQDDEDDED